MFSLLIALLSLTLALNGHAAVWSGPATRIGGWIISFAADGSSTYASCGDKVFKSIDNGATCSALSGTPSLTTVVRGVAVDTTTEILLAAVERNLVMRSTDGGATWFDSYVVYVGSTIGNLYESTDAGESWPWLGRPVMASIYSIAVNQDNPQGDLKWAF